MMRYKYYSAQVELDGEPQLFHGEVVNIRDVITFQARTAKELESAFEESVEEYLGFFAERNEEPNRPWEERAAHETR